jgi:hypothetical protein
MDCLHCGTKLAILNRISGGAFCSPEHRTQFLAHQDAVMLGRLKAQAGRLKKIRAPIPGSLGEFIAVCPYLAQLEGYPSRESLPEVFQGFDGFPPVIVAVGTQAQPFTVQIPEAPFQFSRLNATNVPEALPLIAPLDTENSTIFLPITRHAAVELIPRELRDLFAARAMTGIGPRTVSVKAGPSPAALMSAVLFPSRPPAVRDKKDFPAPPFLPVRVAIAYSGSDLPTGLDPLSFTTLMMAPASRLIAPSLETCSLFAQIRVRPAQPHLDSLKPADLSDWSVEEPTNLPAPKTSALVFTPQFGAMILLPPKSSVPDPGTLPIASQALPLPSSALQWSLHPKTASETCTLVFTPQFGAMILLPLTSSVPDPGTLPIASQALPLPSSAPQWSLHPKTAPETSTLIFTPQFGAMVLLPPASSVSNPGTLPIASQALPLPSNAPQWSLHPKTESETSTLIFTPQFGAMVLLPPASSVSNPGALPIASRALPLPSGAPLWTLHPKAAFLCLEYSNRVAAYRFFARSSGARKLSINAVTTLHADPVVFTPSMRIASPGPPVCSVVTISVAAVENPEKFSMQIAPLPPDISMVGPGLASSLVRSPMPAMAQTTQSIQGPQAVRPHELKTEEPLPFERKTLKPDFKVVSVRSQSKIPEPSRRWWAHVPMPAQRVLMALPILLAISVYFLGGRASTAAAKRLPLNPVSENFAAGLKSWSGAAGWSKTWKADPETGAEPGSFALLSTTELFADYEFGFSGAIEKKSMGFAVRAADLKNYYAVKIAYRKSGKSPGLYILRYPVIAGKSEKATEVPLRVEMNPEAEMQVKLDVSGDTYTLSVGGQVADSWNEARLTHGAIGFFAAKDERFRVQNVNVIPE